MMFCIMHGYIYISVGGYGSERELKNKFRS